ADDGIRDRNVTGVQTCALPIFAIASTIFTNKLGQDNFQETNPVKLFDDCSKYAYMASTPQQFPHIMQMAIQTSIQEQGVSVVGLPGDVAAAEAEEIVTSTQNYRPASRYLPTDEELDELAEILNGNKKITLYGGYGSRN